MMPGLPVSSIRQWKSNRHEGACLEFFQGIGLFEPTFIAAHQALKMISKVRLLKSRIKKCSFLEAIITSRNELFEDCVSDLAVEIQNLGNPTRGTAEINDPVKQIVGS
jgi:hypothetical protein